MAQATANPYRMEAVIANTGVNTQNNVTLHVDVEEPNGTVSSFMSSPSNLVGAPNPANDTAATTATFNPSSMGYMIFHSGQLLILSFNRYCYNEFNCYRQCLRCRL